MKNQSSNEHKWVIYDFELVIRLLSDYLVLEKNRKKSYIKRSRKRRRKKKKNGMIMKKNVRKRRGGNERRRSCLWRKTDKNDRIEWVYFFFFLDNWIFNSFDLWKQEERYIEMVSPKEDVRYSSERQVDRYYEERRPDHFRDSREERDFAMSGNGNVARYSQESDPDRGNFCTFSFIYCA